MSLEQAIHQRWADSAPLSALLPPERVTTGRSGDGGVPYVTIIASERRGALPTNSGNAVREVEVNMSLWHDDFGSGEEIVEYVYNLYHLATFNLSGETAVVRMREDSMSTTHGEDGRWCWKIKFTAKICAILDE